MKNTFELSHYNYDLPESLIAKYPTEKRVGAKLLVLESNNQIKHTKFSNILDYLETGDTLVLNNTKVFPARIYGKKKNTGGIVETLLSRPAENTDKENEDSQKDQHK